MDFTEVYKANAALFSPDCRYVLVVADSRVVVRQANTFQITHTWPLESIPTMTSSNGAGSSRTVASANDTVQCGWSTDSRYLFAATPSGQGKDARNAAPCVQVFDVLDKKWSATISIGVEGLSKCIWAPDGRSLLCFSEWGVSAVVYNLWKSNDVFMTAY